LTVDLMLRGNGLASIRFALESADPRALGKDAKTLLQEFLQGRHIPLPKYSVVSTAGEAHEQTFCVECAIPELNVRTQGEGTSRRGAEQVAARRAYDLVSQA
jgi:ribonuclease-3